MGQYGCSSPSTKELDDLGQRATHLAARRRHGIVRRDIPRRLCGRFCRKGRAVLLRSFWRKRAGRLLRAVGDQEKPETKNGKL